MSGSRGSLCIKLKKIQEYEEQLAYTKRRGSYTESSVDPLSVSSCSLSCLWFLVIFPEPSTQMSKQSQPFHFFLRNKYLSCHLTPTQNMNNTEFLNQMNNYLSKKLPCPK